MWTNEKKIRDKWKRNERQIKNKTGTAMALPKLCNFWWKSDTVWSKYSTEHERIGVVPKKNKNKAPLFYTWLVTVPHAIRHRLEPFLFGISSVVFMWLRFCIIIFLSYFFIFSSLNLNVFLYIFFWQKEKQFINSKDGSTCPKGVARLVRGVSLGLFWYIRRAYRDSTPPPPQAQVLIQMLGKSWDGFVGLGFTRLDRVLRA